MPIFRVKYVKFTPGNFFYTDMSVSVTNIRYAQDLVIMMITIMIMMTTRLIMMMVTMVILTKMMKMMTPMPMMID